MLVNEHFPFDLIFGGCLRALQLKGSQQNQMMN